MFRVNNPFRSDTFEVIFEGSKDSEAWPIFTAWCDGAGVARINFIARMSGETYKRFCKFSKSVHWPTTDDIFTVVQTGAVSQTYHGIRTYSEESNVRSGFVAVMRERQTDLWEVTGEGFLAEIDSYYKDHVPSRIIRRHIIKLPELK